MSSSNSGNPLIMALLIILSIDVVFFLAQESLSNINPSGTQFSTEHLINAYGDNYSINPNGVSLELPDTEGSINPETGNIFTDSFIAIKTWFSDSTGLSYLKNFVGAPVTFLNAILPDEEYKTFIFSITALWYGLTLFVIIAFAIGRL
jgi:hypothetical protein